MHTDAERSGQGIGRATTDSDRSISYKSSTDRVAPNNAFR